MTANHNSRSFGKLTPNQNLSVPDVSVPSHTPSGLFLNQRVAVGRKSFTHLSHFSHSSHPRNPRSPTVPSAPSCAGQKSPNFTEFTRRNPLISRVCTGLHLN